MASRSHRAPQTWVRNFLPALEFNYLGASGKSEVPESPDPDGFRTNIRDLARAKKMRYLKCLALLAFFMFPAALPSHAQRVVIGVGVGPAYLGPAPVCAYGYYGYYPYACAPYGYYGPDYFVSGGFIGAGPWFHGFFGRPGFYMRGCFGRGFYRRRGFEREREFEGHERCERRGFRDGGRGFEGHERFEHGGFRDGDRGFHGGGEHGGGRGHGGGHR